MPDIGTEADRRGITRLCHFTRLSLFRGIVEDRAILSTQELIDREPLTLRNDPVRFDGYLGYVSCTVQFPNLHVLDGFRRNIDQEVQWIVLLLNPGLLALPSTLFSPVNAATASGGYVAGGFDGFDAMFQTQPPSRHFIYRGPNHLESCPTDNQAEVLVHHKIPAEAIIGVVCQTAIGREQVDRLLSTWEGLPPENSERAVLFDSNYVKELIWMGYDMDLAVRKA